MRMHKKIIRTSIVLVLVVVMSNVVMAAFPEKQGFVNDFANVLDQKQGRNAAPWREVME